MCTLTQSDINWLTYKAFCASAWFISRVLQLLVSRRGFFVVVFITVAAYIAPLLLTYFFFFFLLIQARHVCSVQFILHRNKHVPPPPPHPNLWCFLSRQTPTAVSLKAAEYNLLSTMAA